MSKDFKPEIEFDLQLFAEEEGTPAEDVQEADEDLEEDYEDDGEVDDSEEEELSEFELKVKYNDEESVITDREKAIELAQKGMNYDKIKSKYGDLEKEMKKANDDPMKKWAMERMKNSGYDNPDDFFKAIDLQQREKKYEDAGMTPKQAREESERDYRLEQLEGKLKEKETVEDEQKEMQEFLDWYSEKQGAGIFDGELDVETIPPEVWEATENGTSLKQAYMEHALENLSKNAEQDVLKKMEENKKSSTGSTQDNNQTNETSEWTTDYVNKMVDKKGDSWIEENFDRIEKSGYFNNVT